MNLGCSFFVYKKFILPPYIRHGRMLYYTCIFCTALKEKKHAEGMCSCTAERDESASEKRTDTERRIPETIG